ncbi:hypothetical protein ACIBHX_08345 [Nonomuraea sp. NPDC050536]|uniref:hypothetical protein n=1 Tax=Nonomuraea sp. NPDC050536 TaxID=3364366 RepID=UPI0037CC1229
MSEELPDLPDFDPGRTRKAVRRGLYRTVTIVLAILLVLALAATEGSRLVQMRGDREERMVDVLGTAFKLYNPGYVIDWATCCETSPWSMSFTVDAKPLIAGYSSYGGAYYPISQDFFGRVDHLPLGNEAKTPLSTALSDLGTDMRPKDEVRKVLARLPSDLRALAVVEFVKPLNDQEMRAFNGYCPTSVVYEHRPSDMPITWGDTTWDRGPVGDGCEWRLRNFRAWVNVLQDSDQANLSSFGLSLDRLRKAASDGLAYAYVDNLTSIAKLRKIIEDPRVKTVRLADAAFDLDHS